MTKCKGCGKPHPFIDSDCLTWTCGDCCKEEEN